MSVFRSHLDYPDYIVIEKVPETRRRLVARFVAILTQWDDGEHLPANIERLANFLIDAIEPEVTQQRGSDQKTLLWEN